MKSAAFELDSYIDNLKEQVDMAIINQQYKMIILAKDFVKDLLHY
jgi:hypothetical protein